MKTQVWSSSHPDTLHHPFSSTLLRPGHLSWKSFHLPKEGHVPPCLPQSCLGELFSRPWVTPLCRHEAGRQWTSVCFSIIISVSEESSEGAGWNSLFLCYTILHATAGEYFSLKSFYTIFFSVYSIITRDQGLEHHWFAENGTVRSFTTFFSRRIVFDTWAYYIRMGKLFVLIFIIGLKQFVFLVIIRSLRKVAFVNLEGD